ncbi:DHHW family protein [Clostridium sp.]|uniref:DHHW family protein n=1 Tax=Clostridium sp. TaxID=1506 RepID=UPI002E7A397B|nr:DHHW family protein [Clostridium sp.]MEE0567467.1 DHHW family protein [Clostridium sp.]
MKKNILKKYPTFFVFSILVILFTVIDIINSPNEFSELENRKLSQMPILSLKSYIDTSFSSDYEKYINDQFFLRNNWIDLKSRIEYLLGKRENNDIIFGKENYLFKKFTTFNDEMLENNLNSIITFTNNYNKEVDFFIIPNSYAIYDELTPRYLPLVDQLSLINSINSYLSLKSNDHINTINVAEELLKNKDDYIYYKTDHHWTSYGAYLAYLTYMDYLGLEIVDINNLEKITINNFLGTYYNRSKYFKADSDFITYYNILGLHIEIDGKEQLSLMDLDKFKGSDKYSAFLWGNNGLTKVINENISEERKGSSILIFKDSYANSFIQFLSYNYEIIDIIDLRYFKESIRNFMKDKDYNEILIMYSFNNLSTDINIRRLKF